MIHNYLKNTLRAYGDRRIAIILLLGFSSGLPLLLSASTLGIWLAEDGISKATIGVFSLVGLPYTCKFLWAPFFDRARIPGLSAWMGQRRSFMLVLQALLFCVLIMLGCVTPSEYPVATALLALLVAFLSASQDIVIDAFRVEILDETSYGPGAATVVFGYRLGMLAAGAGALYLASLLSWHLAYAIMAALMLVGMIAVMLSTEPPAQSMPKTSLRRAMSDHVRAFIQKRDWLFIVLLIATYKLGDAFFTTMANVFFLELNYSKVEIANVYKIFGLVATIFGGFIAGFMSAKMGIMRAMLIAGVIHVVLNLVFVAQAYVGYNLPFLFMAITVENITAGMTTVMLVAFISSQCDIKNTAAHYALLSSLAAIPRTVLSSSAGYCADLLGWPMFFAFTSLLGVPALFMVARLIKGEGAEPHREPLYAQA